MREAWKVITVATSIMGLLFLAGNAGDQACPGGQVKTADVLCKDSGGTWDDSSCPSACWPPACGQPLTMACISVCGSEPVCSCPKSAPYWEDGRGCVAATQCDTVPTCTQAGGQCAVYLGGTHQCPAQHPNSFPEAGSCPGDFVAEACCL